MLEALLARFQNGDRRSLSRLLTLASRGEFPTGSLSNLARGRPARVVAFTGGGGVGKSTLIGKLIEHLRHVGQSVAVLACDPESPLSGGALLGDRFRMAVAPDDDGVFIRSLAAPGGGGGLAEHLPDLVRLLEVFGFDVILIETVGAGQGDTAVRELADVVVLLLQPHTGDDLQWEKAGVLEVADVVVIHKADLPGAADVEAQVRASLGLAEKAPPVILVSAKTNAGIDQLWEAVASCPLRQRDVAARELLRLAQEKLKRRFSQASDSELSALAARWQNGEVSVDEAVDAFWAKLR